MENKKEILKIKSLNTRGLGNPRKRQNIFRWLRSNHNGIVYLQETHTTEGVETNWKKEWNGNIEFSHGTCGSRGVAILFPNNTDVSIVSKYADSQGRALLLDTIIDGQNIVLLNVYAPNSDKTRDQSQFAELISEKLENHKNKYIIVGGDLNTYFDPYLDKKEGTSKDKTKFAQDIQLMCENIGLVDIFRVTNPETKRYTWRGMTKRGQAASRLDYFLVSVPLIYDLVETTIEPSILSDHSLISLTIKIAESIKKGKGFWKFNTSLLKDKKYINEIKTLVNECKEKYGQLRDKNLAWDLTKMEIRSKTISYSSYKAKQQKQLESTLIADLKRLESRMDNDITYKEEYDTVKRELETINNYKTQGIITRSRAQWVENDEKCTEYFLKLEQQNCNNKYIKALKTQDGRMLSSLNDVLDEEENFYKKLYTAEEYVEHECDLLANDIPQLSDESKTLCDRNITLEECGKALAELPNGKSPGSDGLSADFYKFFWPDVKDLIFECFEYAFTIGELSIDQKRSIITLLPKGNKDTRELKNWRPISLLNTDYKILAKLLANRLHKTLPTIISEDQSGYIKGRYIGENIRTIVDLIDITKHKINPGVILFLDFEKAFDSVSWDFLFKVLKRFNFGDVFITWIKILYCNPCASIINNGYTTKTFELSRGIRQGCPISALLFILIVEIMAINIKRDEDIKGININENKQIFISQLADDTSLFLKDNKSLKRAFKILEHLRKCSGLRLNMDKTKALLLGSYNNLNIDQYGIANVKDTIKVLGINIGKNPQLIISDTFNERIKKLKTLLNMWRARNISIKGKITLLRTKAMPLMLYPATILYTPDEVIKEVEEIFFNFIWPKRKHHVKKSVLKQKIEDGGLRMPCFKTMTKSLKMRWIKAFVMKDNNYIEIVKACLNTEDLRKVINEKMTFEEQHLRPSRFYKQLFDVWHEIHIREPDNTNEILNETLWCNHLIQVGDKPCCFSEMKEKGVLKLRDILNLDGSFKSKESIERSHNMTLNIMHYNSIKSAIPKTWLAQLRRRNKEVHFKETDNEGKVKINGKWQLIIKTTNKQYYWELMKRNKDKSKAIEKWEENYLHNFDWSEIFKLPYEITKETKLQSLQY